MSNILPTVRHLIACEDIRTDPAHPRKVSLINLLSGIRSVEQPPFPFLYRELCVFVQMSECRGSADIALTIVHAETEASVYSGRGKPWRPNLPDDPLKIAGLRFRIQEIEFTEPGLYWIQLWYNDTMLSQEPLVVR
jgi:hypothetical protein